MSDRFLVSAVGAVIAVDSASRGGSFQRRARDAWSDALIDGEADEDAVVTVRDTVSDDEALSLLSTDITLAALSHRQGDQLWMLHAAGLAEESGRVVVLSAASGTGKTTAARHLSRDYAYVSDETIAIDGTGAVLPYRKPLSIIDPQAAHKVQTALSSIDGGRALPASLRVAKIVVLDRSPDGPLEPVLEELDTATALELLAPQTSYLAHIPEPLQLIDALLTATGGAVRLRYREISTVDAAIGTLIATEPAAVSRISPVGAANTAPAIAPREGGFARADAVDALDLRDGRLAVLRRSREGGLVSILDGIGPAIWGAANATGLDEIVRAVVAAHGTPDRVDAAQAVASAAQHLVDEGLLQRFPAQA
ncbi:hypothetical protein KZC51_07230 [Microbacterium sp. SSW1-49]|uniref:PqqD family peptide modification chaperone n=1 Tax=Microbacterium croceum TaxID=2851645 RepID=A0ABT0FD22_9MICO|nr:ATP-binding protein [Microbacterium croceum]MCK2035925.1 hypothetical protein [Microbacterium croceum]